MFGRSTSQFDKALEKGTSQLLLEPDWDSILAICDSVRGGDTKGKYAVDAIRKKVNHDNPRVEMYALQVLESVMKNCGATVHSEVATKEFMESFKELVKIRPDPVKGKILELVQVWSHAFRNESKYKIIQDTYHLMKMEGYQFPVLKEADAMFASESAPEWHDGENCHRCRVEFGTFTRKHHCRCCGQVFCNKCSSKLSIIPKFGIEKEVRVCDSCFDILNPNATPGESPKPAEGDLPAEYLASPLSKQQQTPPTKTEQEIQEEEELQLALALSQSEAESKAKDRQRLRNNYSSLSSSPGNRSTSPQQSQQEPAVNMSVPTFDTSDMDPELARYLNRNYWEQKQSEAKPTVSTTIASAPSAPVVTTTEAKMTTPQTTQEVLQQNGDNEVEQEQFLKALQTSLEIFVNRMKSNSQRGRSITNDSSVQTLFMTLNAMHPQLMKYTSEQEDKRGYYESLQDKLAQLKDAREALNALREDHREKRRREAEEQERVRQIQMAHKLEIMRQKKQEYLEYQRQVAMQRLQEQEHELLMRQEQIKQMTQMRQMQQYGYPQPQMYGQPPVQGYSPAGSVEGSPHHAMHTAAYGQQVPMGQPGPQQMQAMGQPGGPPMQQMGLPAGASPRQPHMVPPMPGMPPGAPNPQFIPARQPGYGGMNPNPSNFPPQEPQTSSYQQPTSNFQQMPPGSQQGPIMTSGGQPQFQPGVSQAPPPGGMPPFQPQSSQSLPSGQPQFQPQSTVAPGGQPQFQPQSTAAPPGGQPSFQGVPPQGYGQQPFNMQGMQSSLPQQPIYQQAPSQQYGGAPQVQQYAGGPPPPQQPPQQEAELISFD